MSADNNTTNNNTNTTNANVDVQSLLNVAMARTASQQHQQMFSPYSQPAQSFPASAVQDAIAASQMMDVMNTINAANNSFTAPSPLLNNSASSSTSSLQSGGGPSMMQIQSFMAAASPFQVSAPADWMSPIAMNRDASMMSQAAILAASPAMSVHNGVGTPLMTPSDALNVLAAFSTMNSNHNGSGLSLPPPTPIYPSGNASGDAFAPVGSKLFSKHTPVAPVHALASSIMSGSGASGHASTSSSGHRDESPTSPTLSSTSSSARASTSASASASANALAVANKHRERFLDRDALLQQIEDKRRKNTESARKSRERKAKHMEELEIAVHDAMQRIKALEAENAKLRQRLAELDGDGAAANGSGNGNGSAPAATKRRKRD
ncbi:hypothetical protein BC831DRAFT_458063 [Entophlyctis helioformis]|nr:hypothetical protein BC831DRAFT_458063 [Entophlyctis helioformis]